MADPPKQFDCNSIYQLIDEIARIYLISKSDISCRYHRIGGGADILKDRAHL
jgi:hypothetical protein